VDPLRGRPHLDAQGQIVPWGNPSFDLLANLKEGILLCF
jgi:hypothetical protein